MLPDPKRVKEIFLEAAELPDEASRTEYLDRVCMGDSTLRSRVEELLDSHDPDGSFLGTPAAVVPEPEFAGTLTFDSSSPNSPRDTTSDESDSLQFLTPSKRPDSLGRLGHYEVLQVLGKGGFGIVFRAFDDTLQRVVAIKVLAPEIAATSPARRRFLREARSSAKVRHENIVQVYAVEELPLPYLVMEFVPGETLQERLDRTGPLDPLEVVKIGKQIAEGLASAHATGLIHRDIKPANILIEGSPQQHVKITDFGLARAADDASLTQSGMVAGTPMYMAPEQAQGDPLDHRADLFSLGSVLYAICAGRPPFRANSTLAVLKRVSEDTPRPIPEIIPEVPRWLCDIISKLHAKKPEERFATAQEVADLLARGLTAMQHPGQAPAPVVAMPTPEQKPTKPQTPATPTAPRSRGRLLPAFAVTFLLLLVAFGVAEATGFTNARGAISRLMNPEGTLLVEVEDVDATILIDGAEISVTEAGVKEIRLKTGTHVLEVRKDNKTVRRAQINVAKDTPAVVQIKRETVVVQAPKPPDVTPNPTPTPKPAAPVRAPAPPGWTVLKPAEMKSGAGSTLTLQPDSSILASGTLPDTDSYVLTFRGLPAMMQALRLEVLPHDTLPQKGPGRNDNGEFVLTTIKAQLELPKKPPQDLKLAKAWADQSRGDDSYVHFAIDTEDNTGWVSEVGKAHFAVFEFADRIAPSEDAVLKVTLEFKHSDHKKVLGCFRFSATPDENAALAAWAKQVATLTPDKQLEEVRKELQRRNPGYDGFMMPGYADNTPGAAIVALKLPTQQITDISPVRGFPRLHTLESEGTYPPPNGVLVDLSPLRGMPLTHLLIRNNRVTDITPLKGMPLKWLLLDENPISDLSVLKDMPLENLSIQGLTVKDLNSLQGLKLTHLNCIALQITDLKPLIGMPLKELTLHAATELSDLTPLKDLPLEMLNVHRTKVSDLRPLAGMKITGLYISETKVTDLRPIKNLPLQKIHGDFLHPRDTAILRSIKTLKEINGKPAAQFLAELEATAEDIDRSVAGDVLSIGASVRINGQEVDIKRKADLPPEPFRLTGINLFKNEIIFGNEEGLKFFKDCKHLEFLNLDHARSINNDALAYLSTRKSIKYLNVGHTQVTDAGLVYLKDLENLEHLNLDGLTEVSNDGLPHLKGCKNLRILWAQGTKITAAGFAHLKNCKAIMELNLNGSPVADAGLAHLKEFKNLSNLFLHNTLDNMNVTDAGLKHLKECKTLVQLNLLKNKVTAEGIKELAAALPKCRIEWDGGIVEPK